MLLKIYKIENPNVLLAQIVKLEGDCAKVITKFGFTALSAKNMLRAKGNLKGEPIRDNLDN